MAPKKAKPLVKKVKKTPSEDEEKTSLAKVPKATVQKKPTQKKATTAPGGVGNNVKRKGPKGKGKKKKGKKGKKKKKRTKRCPIKRRKKAIKRKCTDPFEPAAMLNLYYIAHSVSDALTIRKLAPKNKKK